jgi:uncharacterized protein
LIRFFIIIGIFYLAFKILKLALLKGNSYKQGIGRKSASEIDDVMIKDPFCGVYFPQRNRVSANIKGNTLYFCSSECRNKYIESHSKRRDL